jgi:hypothetical protein
LNNGKQREKHLAKIHETELHYYSHQRRRIISSNDKQLGVSMFGVEKRIFKMEERKDGTWKRLLTIKKR